MEGCLMLRDWGGGCILGHSMKKGSNHGREGQVEGSIVHGYTNPKPASSNV